MGAENRSADRSRRRIAGHVFRLSGSSNIDKNLVSGLRNPSASHLHRSLSPGPLFLVALRFESPTDLLEERSPGGSLSPVVVMVPRDLLERPTVHRELFEDATSHLAKDGIAPPDPKLEQLAEILDLRLESQVEPFEPREVEVRERYPESIKTFRSFYLGRMYEVGRGRRARNERRDRIRTVALEPVAVSSYIPPGPLPFAVEPARVTKLAPRAVR